MSINYNKNNLEKLLKQKRKLIINDPSYLLNNFLEKELKINDIEISSHKDDNVLVINIEDKYVNKLNHLHHNDILGIIKLLIKSDAQVEHSDIKDIEKLLSKLNLNREKLQDYIQDIDIDEIEIEDIININSSMIILTEYIELYVKIYEIMKLKYEHDIGIYSALSENKIDEDLIWGGDILKFL